MSIASRAVRFVVEHVGKNALAATGTQIGEAIGRRTAARIYTPTVAAPPGKDRP